MWHFPHSVAFVGPWQFYTGYCLLASREHASELNQLGANRAAFLNEMAILAEAIEACFQPHKLNYELLGNVVPHLHWHIFPRLRGRPGKARQCGWHWNVRRPTRPKSRDWKRAACRRRKSRLAFTTG